MLGSRSQDRPDCRAVAENSANKRAVAVRSPCPSRAARNLAARTHGYGEDETRVLLSAHIIKPQSPLDYLFRWRMAIARTALRDSRIGQ